MSNLSLVETDSNILLNKIFEKLERIENRLVKAEEMLAAGNNIFATSIDSIDSIMTSPDKNLKMEKIQVLAKKLTENEVLDRFILISEKFEQIYPLLENNNLIQIIVDSIDDISSKLKDSGIELSSVIPNMAKVLPKILDDRPVEIISKLLENANLLTTDESFNKIINDLQSLISLDKTEKIIEGIKLSNEEANNLSEKPGVLDILKLLNNPDVRKQIYASLLAVKNISSSLKK